MDFLCFERRVDPGGDKFSWRFWRHFDEAFWVGLEGAIEDFLAGVIDFFGLAVMNLIRRPQPDTGVVMVAIAPAEEVMDEGLCFLDAAGRIEREEEPGWRRPERKIRDDAAANSNFATDREGFEISGEISIVEARPRKCADGF